MQERAYAGRSTSEMNQKGKIEMLYRKSSEGVICRFIAFEVFFGHAIQIEKHSPPLLETTTSEHRRLEERTAGRNSFTKVLQKRVYHLRAR